eukprot:4515855-Pyramimonas_sp.AAC.1
MMMMMMMGMMMRRRRRRMRMMRRRRMMTTMMGRRGTKDVDDDTDDTGVDGDGEDASDGKDDATYRRMTKCMMRMTPHKRTVWMRIKIRHGGDMRGPTETVRHCARRMMRHLGGRSRASRSATTTPR